MRPLKCAWGVNGMLLLMASWCLVSRCPRDTAALLLCQKVSADGPILLAPLAHDTAAVREMVSQVA